MSDLEDDLQRMLATRAGEVDPQLTGAGIRALAAGRRGRRLRTVGLPAAGTVLAAALLITPFVLIHSDDSLPRPGPVIVPAGSQLPVPGSRTPPSTWPSPAASRPPIASPSAPLVQLTLEPGASLPSSEVTAVPTPTPTTSQVPTAVPTGPVPSR